MAPKFDPGSCPKPAPPPPVSCLDSAAARQCVCTSCTCGKHGCVPVETSKFQPLDIKAMDVRFQGATEYTSKYDRKHSQADRKAKDGITLKGCYPTHDYYPKSINSEYVSTYVDKPLFPARAWKKPSDDDGRRTFMGRTTYHDSYLKWGVNPRDAVRPPAFEASKEPFEGATLYTTQFNDKSRPVQPWRKLEHWPHSYGLCEAHHPRRSGPCKPQAERANVINIPPSGLKDDTTYGEHYTNWGVQENIRTLKPVRWGPTTEPFGGPTTYSDHFRGPPGDGKKCPVLMRPRPTATVGNHQCYP